MFGVIVFIVIFSTFLSWAWVRGISSMKESHPDYRGEDFLDCDEEDCVTKIAGRDGWDDNNIHSEGNF
jgi:hypothetical protein